MFLATQDVDHAVTLLSVSACCAVHASTGRPGCSSSGAAREGLALYMGSHSSRSGKILEKSHLVQ